ncbi:MAG: hypothetical protein R2684_15445 [Pyrinomonadaceae bacterium]
MSYAEQYEANPKLIELWDRADKNPDIYLKAIRQELVKDGQKEILYCDGGMMLISKSDDKDDMALGIKSVKQCSLAEIEQTPYFHMLFTLSVRGVDVFDLQTRLLKKPKFSAYIPLHNLQLDQTIAFAYPFLIKSDFSYLPRLKTLLKIETDETARQTIIHAMWVSTMPEAEIALRELTELKELDGRESTKYAKSLLKVSNDLRKLKPDHEVLVKMRQNLEVNEKTTLEELREKRRLRMHAVSDEALYDLRYYTMLIYSQTPEPTKSKEKDPPRENP